MSAPDSSPLPSSLSVPSEDVDTTPPKPSSQDEKATDLSTGLSSSSQTPYDPDHLSKAEPTELSLDNRLDSLKDLLTDASTIPLPSTPRKGPHETPLPPPTPYAHTPRSSALGSDFKNPLLVSAHMSPMQDTSLTYAMQGAKNFCYATKDTTSARALQLMYDEAKKDEKKIGMLKKVIRDGDQHYGEDCENFLEDLEYFKKLQTWEKRGNGH